jgi:hypothetical protein
MPSVSVYSIYMNNIEEVVVKRQREVVELFLPDKWNFEQVLFTPKSGEWFHHATALEECQKRNKADITVFLDIDCIPLSEKAFTTLSDEAVHGTLIGAVQRANHLRNDSHLYIGPFCMAFLNSQYKKLGSPSFKETDRGDCAEELTYQWDENTQPTKMLWPTNVYHKAWALTPDVQFGFGTTYENLFYHAFAIRQSVMQGEFIKKCDEVLAANPPRKIVVQEVKEVKKETKKEVKKEEKKAILMDEPKKTIPASEEIKPRETKKEVTIKEEVKPKERVAI